MVVLILALLFWLNFLLMFWAYFGYPLLMYVLSKVAQKPIRKEPIQPSITLLIPAYNEVDVIARKLNNSLALTYPREKLEILVVDDGSNDGTTEIISRYQEKGVKLIKQPVRGGKMAGVNTGFEMAKGEIIVLSDASPSYEEGSLELLIAPFADPQVGVVVGTLAIWDSNQGVAKQAGLYWKYEAALRRWESSTGSTVAVHGNMFALRKSLYRPLSSRTVNDEFSLAMETIKQGYRVVYEPAAISYDEASSSMEDEFNRRVRINAGRYQALFSAGYLKAPTWGMSFRLFSHKLLRPLSPVFMLLMLVTNILTVLLPRVEGSPLVYLQGWFGWLVLVGQIAFYGLAWLGSLAEGRGVKKKPVFLSLPYFFVSTNLAALLGLWRWLANRQTVKWQKRAAG